MILSPLNLYWKLITSHIVITVPELHFLITIYRRLRWTVHSLDGLSTIRTSRVQFTVYMSPVFPCIWVHGSKRNLPSSSPDLILVNFLLCRVLQQKMVSSRLPRRWSSEVCPVTLCDHMHWRDARPTVKMSGEGCWIAVDLLIFIVSDDCQFWGNYVQ